MCATFGAAVVVAVALVVASAGAAGTCGDGVLDSGEACDDGNTSAGDCCSPSCQLEAATVVCRSAAGICDVAEHCPGDAPTCPPDAFAPADVSCRAAAGSCDVAETCTGTSPHCPPDATRAAGTACDDDGLVCTVDRCDAAGACLHEPDAGACTAGACAVARCDPGAGCVSSAAPDGTPCDDGDECTGEGVCRAGACVPTGLVRCATVTLEGTRLRVVCVASGTGRGSCAVAVRVTAPPEGVGALARRPKVRKLDGDGMVHLTLRLGRRVRRLLHGATVVGLDVDVTVTRDGEGAIFRRSVVLR